MFLQQADDDLVDNEEDADDELGDDDDPDDDDPEADDEFTTFGRPKSRRG